MVKLAVRFAAAIALVAALQTPDPSGDARALYIAALAAKEKGDLAGYLTNARDAAALRPMHPIILYHLASAYALNHQPEQAGDVLRRLANLAVYRDIANDPSFASAVNHRSIQTAIRDLVRVKHRRIGAGTVYRTIPDPAFIPEGIAYDPTSRSLFVSSQHERKIVRIDPDGRVTDFITEAQDGIWMVFGIAIDPARRRLWAVSTAERPMRGFRDADEKRAGLFAFDLTNGKLVQKIVMEPSDAPPHYFDDLTIAPDGRVFLSDGGSSTVYVLQPGERELRVLVAPRTIQGPNGLAMTPNGRWLYVSDYAGFIVRVDPASGEATRLPQPKNAAIYGIDGLSWHSTGLIGIQNGVEPSRVLRLQLSPTGLEIRKVEILEMNNPAFEEPTLGVVVGDDLYCVANSHGGVLRRDAETVSKRLLSPPAIVRVRLK